MQISFANENDTQKIYDIWSVCFSDGKEYLDWYFKDIYKSKNTLILSLSDKIVATAQILPYEISSFGEKFSVGYVAGVATLPEYRNRGFAASLLQEADSKMKERDYKIAALIPFNFDFYRRFGYREYGENVIVEANIKDLMQFKNQGEFKEYSKAPVEIYNEFTKGSDTFILRDEKLFDEIYAGVKSAGGHFLVSDDGYIIYYKNDGVLNVCEIAYTSKKALEKILGFIAFQNAEKFIIKNAVAEDFKDFKNKENYRQMMAKSLTNEEIKVGKSFLSMPDWI